LKSSFNKIKRKSIEWGSNKKKQQKFWLKNEIESKKNFKKGSRKKNQNQKNKDQNKKTKHIRNCSWRTKLKTKTSIK
jgi:hypothetical protein